jgi:subtilisin family serine protease
LENSANTLDVIPEIHTNYGFDGTGRKLAQLEVFGQVSSLQTNLNQWIQGNSGACDGTTELGFGHATEVAGVMISHHSTVKGLAPDAQLWAGGGCNSDDATLQSDADAAASWGARAINISYGHDQDAGVPNGHARFFDGVVVNSWRTVVAAAGNEAPPCATSARIINPAVAYNLITVGALDDFGTPAWWLDTIWNCSSYLDPISITGDREKPEVAAPGVVINSTTSGMGSPFETNDGTSLAAPHVTGTAALMMEQSTILEVWPEAVKAIIMVTARDNVEGSSRLSDKDGAGGIWSLGASKVIDGSEGGWGVWSISCSSVFPRDIPFSLVAGRVTRVVITWDQDPDSPYYEDYPSADLDLYIRNPSNGHVTASASFDNTYEIVEFTPSVTGTHTIRVLNARCESRPEALAVAWYQYPYP